MADKYIDKVKKDGQEYDIHDNRVDDLSSGTKLYKHMMSYQGNYISYFSTSSEPKYRANIFNITASGPSFNAYVYIKDITGGAPGQTVLYGIIQTDNGLEKAPELNITEFWTNATDTVEAL